MASIQNEPMAGDIARRAITRSEQPLKAGNDDGRPASFRACARKTLKYFDALPDAREWAEHLLCRDFPEVCVEEDVRGVWELREIHTTARR